MPDNDPDEPELVRRARRGDAAAFRGLIEFHAETLWRCARALCHDDHEAEDLAQETLVGCPLGTVKSRLHHALDKLRRGKGVVNLFSATGESRSSTP